MSIIESVFPLPDGSGEWVVRAFQYPTAERAREVWEKIEAESRGKGQNFSIWRAMNPEMTEHFVVVCGRPKDLPEVPGGTSIPLPGEMAKLYALRRAKRGDDWFKEHPTERLSESVRYGEEAPVIVTEKGDVKPYKPS